MLVHRGESGPVTAMMTRTTRSRAGPTVEQTPAVGPAARPPMAFTPAVPGTAVRMPKLGEVMYSANGAAATKHVASHSFTKLRPVTMEAMAQCMPAASFMCQSTRTQCRCRCCQFTTMAWTHNGGELGHTQCGNNKPRPPEHLIDFLFLFATACISEPCFPLDVARARQALHWACWSTTVACSSPSSARPGPAGCTRRPWGARAASRLLHTPVCSASRRHLAPARRRGALSMPSPSPLKVGSISSGVRWSQCNTGLRARKERHMCWVVFDVHLCSPRQISPIVS